MLGLNAGFADSASSVGSGSFFFCRPRTTAPIIAYSAVPKQLVCRRSFSHCTWQPSFRSVVLWARPPFAKLEACSRGITRENFRLIAEVAKIRGGNVGLSPSDFSFQ